MTALNTHQKKALLITNFIIKWKILKIQEGCEVGVNACSFNKWHVSALVKNTIDFEPLT